MSPADDDAEVDSRAGEDSGADAGARVRERAVRIDVDLDAVRRNLDVARRLAPGSRAFAVVKADAYGHGAARVARALDRADGFAVVGLGEAEALREAGIDKPVLVMQGPISAEAARRFVELRLWPAVHRAEQHGWLASAGATGAGDGAPDDLPEAWLKVDTGMGRLGVLPDEVAGLLAADGVRWVGVMTHLASADEPGCARTAAQLERFRALDVPPGIARSVGNSAATLAWPDAGQDWIRPGIMLYGANPLDGGRDLPDGIELVPAMSAAAPLLAVKALPRGHRVGYAGTFECPEDMPVGYVAAGYGDGLPRVLDVAEGSPVRADVLVAGRRCPLIGRVSMDSVAVDLRAAPRARAGDPVTLWGPGQPVERLARAAGTISYELLTGIRGARTWRDARAAGRVGGQAGGSTGEGDAAEVSGTAPATAY